MIIRFLCNQISTYGPGGWSPDAPFLSGTEESIVRWAKELQLKGHEVEVYHNGSHGNYGGVMYRDRKLYEGRDGVTINVKSHDIRPKGPTWYLTNETDAGKLDLSRFKGVILPSQWAVDNLGIEHDNIKILPHGYDGELIYPEKKIKNQCLYASSPDRGLAFLRKVWPEVVKQVPDATLIVTYGGEIDAPNTICLGAVDEDTMASIYRASDIWVHPCNGGELFGMTGVKAQVAGCVPVFFPTMALDETVRAGIATDEEHFVEDLVKTMRDESTKTFVRNMLAKERYPDWSETASMLEELCTR